MPKGGKFPVITSTSGKNLKQWEGTIRGELQVVMAKTDRQVLSDMFDAPVAVGLRFYMPRPKSKKKAVFPTTKPDIDKLARAALDALSTVVFRDDAQVIALQARKVYADAGAKLVITIENWS
jgi:Holliday junction resolvase RusA-like endonuclease